MGQPVELSSEQNLLFCFASAKVRTICELTKHFGLFFQFKAFFSCLGPFICRKMPNFAVFYCRDTNLPFLQDSVYGGDFLPLPYIFTSNIHTHARNIQGHSAPNSQIWRHLSCGRPLHARVWSQVLHHLVRSHQAVCVRCVLLATDVYA